MSYKDPSRDESEWDDAGDKYGAAAAASLTSTAGKPYLPPPSNRPPPPPVGGVSVFASSGADLPAAFNPFAQMTPTSAPVVVSQQPVFRPLSQSTQNTTTLPLRPAPSPAAAATPSYQPASSYQPSTPAAGPPPAKPPKPTPSQAPSAASTPGYQGYAYQSPFQNNQQSAPVQAPAPYVPTPTQTPASTYVPTPSTSFTPAVPAARPASSVYTPSHTSVSRGPTMEKSNSRPPQDLPSVIRVPSAVGGRQSIVAVSPSTTQQIQNEMGINAQILAAKFPYFTASEIAAFHQQFSQFDKDGHGVVHPRDLSSVATKTGESYQSVVDKISSMKLTDNDGNVEFDGFLKAVSQLRIEKGVSKPGQKDATKITLHGHSENTTHTINEDEKESFVQHINQQLAGDKDLKGRIPVNSTSMQIFQECQDGLILAKLINDAVPNTIDERVLNLPNKKALSTFQMTENGNVVVNSAKAIGCSVVNIGAQDIKQGTEHLILGLIWQIIKIGLSTFIDIKIHPELYRLLEDGETMEQFLKLPAEQILLRWFNYHLKKAGWPKKVMNFGSDVKDGEAYTVLLSQLSPSTCSRQPLNEKDLFARAEMVLQNADKLGCRKYLTPKTLVGGNTKLNFAFTAHLFNTHPGLEKLTESEMAGLDGWLFGSEGDREARAFALWMNSLGVDPFVQNLFDDLSDGLVILQCIDKVHPGLVEWKKVNKLPVSPSTMSKFKKVENTNYCLTLGKSMKFSLVGIQGSDICDGIKNLTLSLCWQLMREHVIQTLKSLSKGGHEITDADMIQWANATSKRGGKTSFISNFKDPKIRDGIFFLDVLSGMKKGIVNYELIGNGKSDNEAKLNAKYAISIARKLGATIFVLPEDIVEVQPKMILTFVGTLMALDARGIPDGN